MTYYSYPANLTGSAYKGGDVGEPILAPSSGPGAPGFAFQNDPTAGLFSTSPGFLGLSVGGLTALGFTGTSASFASALSVQGALSVAQGAAISGLLTLQHGASIVNDAFTDPNGQVMANPGSVFLSSADGSLWLKQNGLGNTGWVNVGSPQATQPSFPLLAPQGSAAAPEYAFFSSPGTGMFSDVPDSLTFCTAGAGRLSIDSTGHIQTQGDLSVIGALAAQNFSGTSANTNTGDVTLALANGLELTGQALTLHLATAAAPGALSAADYAAFSQKQPAGAYLTALGGDVTATGPGSAAATVVAVGGAGASAIAAAVALSQSATANPDPNTLVLRDGSGAIGGSISGSASLNVLKAGDTMTGPLGISASGTALSVTGTAQISGPLSVGGALAAGNFTGSSSGQNTGDVTVGASGSGLSVSGQTLSLAIATDAQPGALSAADHAAFAQKQASGSYVTALIGDVTAAGPGDAAATVVSVGGSTAVALHSAEQQVKSATPANTPSTLVARDASGNFSAGLIAANLTGAASLNVLKSGDSMTGSLSVAGAVSVTGLVSAANISGSTAGQNTGDVTLGTANGLALTGQVLSLGLVSASAPGALSAADYSAFAAKQGAGDYLTALSGDVVATGPGAASATVSRVGGSSAAAVHSAELLVSAATPGAKPQSLVLRDGSGNFAAGAITASLVGAASANVLKAGDAMTGALSISAAGVALLVSGDTSLGGAAVISGPLSAQNFSGASSGTNTGDLTLGVQTSGLSLTGQVLALSLASASGPGAISQADYQAFSQKQPAGNYLTALSGDVTATGPGSAAATVLQVGGSSAALVHAAEQAVSAAGSAPTAGTLVRRDGGGGFSAGTITASLIGAASLNVLKAGDSMTGALSLGAAGTGLSVVHDAAIGGALVVTGAISGANLSGQNTGDVTLATKNGLSLAGQALSLSLASSSAPGALSAADYTRFDSAATSVSLGGASITALTGDVTASGPGSAPATVAAVGGSTAAKVHGAEVLANAATAQNTAGAIVLRDTSGNFSAGTITAALAGAASQNVLRAGDTVTGPLSLTASGTALAVSQNVTIGGTLAVTGAITSPNLSGQNTGDVALGQNKNGLSLSGQTLQLQLASPTQPGALSAADYATFAAGGGGASAAVTSLTGDVTGTGPGATATTVATVGGALAADVAAAASLVKAATDASTPSALAKRDAQGGIHFAALAVDSTASFGAQLSGTSAVYTSTVAGLSFSASASGSAAAPALAVGSGTGLFFDSPHSGIGVSVAGTQVAYFSGAGLTLSGTLAASNFSGATSGTNTGDVTLGGTTTGLSLSGQALSLRLATSSLAGAISAADWTIFNNKQPAGNYLVSLSGDVVATGPGQVTATVASVGGSTATQVHAAELLANAATNINTASTIVRRDSAGAFLASTSTIVYRAFVEQTNDTGAPLASLYAKSDHNLYYRDSTGAVIQMTNVVPSASVYNSSTNGTVASPAFNVNAHGGLYYDAGNNIGITHNGTEVAAFNQAGITFFQPITTNTTFNNVVTVGALTTTGNITSTAALSAATATVSGKSKLTGAVGIGSAAPTAAGVLLLASGTASAGVSNSGANIQITATSGVAGSFTVTDSDTTIASYFGYNIYTGDGVPNSTVVGAYNGKPLIISIGTGYTNVALSGYNASGAYYWNFGSKTQALSTVGVTGNVAIGATVATGTAAPANGLLVQGNTILQGNLTVSGSVSGVNASFPLVAPAGGAVTAPNYTFTGSTNTGMYSPAASTLALAVNGVAALSFTTGQQATFSSSITGAGDFISTAGRLLSGYTSSSVTVPAVGIGGTSTTTGIYGTASTIGLTAQATSALLATSAGVTLPLPTTASTSIASPILKLNEGTAPLAATGFGVCYVKSADKNLYFKNSGGTEYALTPPASGASTYTRTVTSFASGTNNSVSASQSGSIFTVPSNASVYLPAATVGLEFSLINIGSGAARLSSQNNTDTFTYNGRTISGSPASVFFQSLGAGVTVVCVTAGNWVLDEMSEPGYSQMCEQTSAPGNLSAIGGGPTDTGLLYAKASDKNLYYKTSAGTEYSLTPPATVGTAYALALQTGDYTATSADSGKWFYNLGATASNTITLPSAPAVGTTIGVLSATAQSTATMTLRAPSGAVIQITNAKTISGGAMSCSASGRAQGCALQVIYLGSNLWTWCGGYPYDWAAIA